MSDAPNPPGVFAEWQPRYAEHRLPTFPVHGDSKKPAVTGYLRVGLPSSKQLALKFGEIDAFGIAVGSRNRITVLDVDSPDERILADAMSRVGPSPFIVRSGSGNHHAWYRHNGEQRRIRPVPHEPIDILGAGFVVAPPSRGAKGTYTLVQGTLDDLDRLQLCGTRNLRPMALLGPLSGIFRRASETGLFTGKRSGMRVMWTILMRS